MEHCTIYESQLIGTCIFLCFSFFKMPFTKKFEIPPDEELTVKEINISYPYLKAGSLHLGKYCEKENNVSLPCFKQQPI